MAVGGATERDFTAPAGALTLLLAAGWPDRAKLLELLETSRYEGLQKLSEARGEGPPAWPERFDLVIRTLERWLGACPDGPLDIGPSGTDAILAMACGWSVALTHALAAEPRTLAELDHELKALYGVEITLEHVEALVRSGQAEVLTGDGTGEYRYALSGWGREAIAPLVAAAHYECNFPTNDILAPEILDVEATFQIIGPLLELPPDLEGACHLSVRLPDDKELRAGATVEVRGGHIISSSILLELEPETWATGTPLEWCEAVVDPSKSRLEMGGNTELSGGLLTALHERLFGAR